MGTKSDMRRLERECRAVAISLRIGEAVGWRPLEVRHERESWEASLVANQHDVNLVPGNTDKWIHRKVERALTHWPVSRVRAEWWRKVWHVERTLRATSNRPLR